VMVGVGVRLAVGVTVRVRVGARVGVRLRVSAAVGETGNTVALEIAVKLGCVAGRAWQAATSQLSPQKRPDTHSHLVALMIIPFGDMCYIIS
jgi:hypothetical protein